MIPGLPLHHLRAPVNVRYVVGISVADGTAGSPVTKNLAEHTKYWVLCDHVDQCTCTNPGDVYWIVNPVYRKDGEIRA